MRAVGFVVHPARPAALEAAEALSAWLEDRGIRTSRLEETPSADGDGGSGRGLDLVVSVGGDGTFLRAAHIASRADTPVLGVKVGRVGFLTEVDPQRATPVLERMVEGSARIEDRLAVLAEVEGADTEPQWALNEVIVEKSVRHRLIRLAVIVDETYVTTFSADGVIVATPTGSTAYSFSAGGPIVSPWVPCLIVTPVAAHMVFDRSLVLAPDQRVALEVVGEEPGLLSADGRASQELPVGARVRIERAPTPARFVRPDDAPAFHALVREKFDLPGKDGGTTSEGGG
ncbi:MAG TPA: NAD(+)/NADH kinase [Actinomycetota bacterium]|nr:NAD(+)/NADH kinase [Actinomycetota bacterium]